MTSSIRRTLASPVRRRPAAAVPYSGAMGLHARTIGRLPRPWRTLADWVLTIAVAIAVVLIVETEVAKPFRVPSSSMEPTLKCAKPGDGLHGVVLRPRDRVPPLLPLRLAQARADRRLRGAARRGLTVRRRRRHLRQAADRPPGRHDPRGRRGVRLGERASGSTSRTSPTSRARGDNDYTDRTWQVPRASTSSWATTAATRATRARGARCRASNLIGPLLVRYWPPNRIGLG